VREGGRDRNRGAALAPQALVMSLQNGVENVATPARQPHQTMLPVAVCAASPANQALLALVQLAETSARPL